MKKINNIEDEKFIKGVKEIKLISMHPNEKAKMLDFVLNSTLSEKPIPSPWSYFSIFSSMRTRGNRLVFYSVTSFLILILGTSSIVYASSNTLPGNFLYPVKINVVEPLRSTLTFSLASKAEYESSLATERLMEAETLADQNKLDVQKETQLNNLLAGHTKALNNTLSKMRVKQESSDENIENNDDNIVTNFQASMNAHAQVLDVIRENSDANEQSEDNTSNISKSARDSANDVRGRIESGEIKKSNSYVNKKKSIQSIIDSTTLDISTNNKDEDNSHYKSSDNNDDNKAYNNASNSYSKRKSIIDETNKTLDQAKQLLQESDDDDSKGDSISAYSKLIDSESSAKEAQILLKAGLNFNNR